MLFKTLISNYIFLCCVLSWNGYVVATVVENENFFWGESNGLGDANYSALWYQTAEPTILNNGEEFHDYTASFFSFDGKNLTIEVTDFLLDENGDFYMVKPGELFGRSKVVQGGFPYLKDNERAFETGVAHPEVSLIDHLFLANGEDELWQTGLPRDLELYFRLLGGEALDFYLGISTSSSGRGYNRDARDAYGWIRLRLTPNPSTNIFDQYNDPYVLTMVENAIAYDSEGIIVGTTTAISIPEPNALSLYSFAVMFFVKNPRRSASSAFYSS